MSVLALLTTPTSSGGDSHRVLSVGLRVRPAHGRFVKFYRMRLANQIVVGCNLHSGTIPLNPPSSSAAPSIIGVSLDETKQ